MTTININNEEVKVEDAIENWRESGVCRYCINYRLSLYRKFQDSYQNFYLAHHPDCMCD